MMFKSPMSVAIAIIVACIVGFAMMFAAWEAPAHETRIHAIPLACTEVLELCAPEDPTKPPSDTNACTNVNLFCHPLMNSPDRSCRIQGRFQPVSKYLDPETRIIYGRCICMGAGRCGPGDQPVGEWEKGKLGFITSCETVSAEEAGVACFGKTLKDCIKLK